jgi:hypothetical protein
MPPEAPAPRAELTAVVGRGDAILFTGAGFAADARDRAGEPVPDSPTMVRELWSICFADDEPDASTLADLYDVALRCAPDRLRAYVEARLRLGNHPLPGYYRAWFTAPWRRIYTLNIDDLEDAVARQFELDRLEVVHLNGKVGDDIEQLTFSTLQYAARLARGQREYEQLAADLATSPVVFVGTTLDEAVLWQHADLTRLPPSFLITPSLTRARRALLAGLGVEWIAATAGEAAAALP